MAFQKSAKPRIYRRSIKANPLLESSKPSHFEGWCQWPRSSSWKLTRVYTEFGSQWSSRSPRETRLYRRSIRRPLVEPTKPTFEGGVNGQGAVAEALPEYTPESSSQSGVPEVHAKTRLHRRCIRRLLSWANKTNIWRWESMAQGNSSWSFAWVYTKLSSQSGVLEVHAKPDYRRCIRTLVEPTKPTFEGSVNGQGAVAESYQIMKVVCLQLILRNRRFQSLQVAYPANPSRAVKTNIWRWS